MIESLLAWWLRLRHRRRAAQPATPLRFLFRLGISIAAVQAEIEEQYGASDAIDCALPTSGGRTDRLRSYTLGHPGGAAVQVVYAYREHDGLVWSVRVDHAAPAFAGTLGDVPLASGLEAAIAALGPPHARAQQAPVVVAASWLRAGDGYRIEAYSETYDDIAGYHPAGQIRSVEWFLRDVAPAGYGVAA